MNDKKYKPRMNLDKIQKKRKKSMKNSLVIFALASTLFAGSVFAQGSTTTTKRTVVTSTTTIPHTADMSATATPAAKASVACPTCGTNVSKKKAKAAKKAQVAPATTM